VSSLVPAPAAAARFAGADAVQAAIDERVAAKRLPGAILSLGSGRAPPDYVKGGTLDLESSVKVDENSLWRLASMTKPVAGMAAMLLIGEGRLRLDQPVADFIPGFASMRVMPDPKSTDTRPAARPITIRHLLTHTSGLANAPPGTIGEAYLRLVGGGPGQLPPPQSCAEWIDRMATVPLVVDPGTKWIYSPSLDVIARIIEIVSGMEFDLFLDRRMFAPLKMRSTYFWVPERDKARLVTSYAQREGKLVATDAGPTSWLLNKPRIPSASGGLISSARDFDRFMAMLVNHGTLDGTRVIPADAVRLGLSNLLPPGTDMSQFNAPTGNDGFGAGGRLFMGGPQPGTFGWGGVSGTVGYLNAERKTRLGIYTNIGVGDFIRQALAAARMSPV